METRPTFKHAEVHSHYTPHPRDPRADEAERLVREVNRMKIENPTQATGLYESLIDQLVDNAAQFSNQPEQTKEPADWTPPQRLVWRSSHLSFDRRVQIVESKSLSPSVKAYVSINAGRWLIDCPFPSCNGAQYASFVDRRFYCIDCNNSAVGGQWIEVVWPQNIKELEVALSSRPEAAQNWLPGETVSDLKKQDEIEMAKLASGTREH